MELANAVRGSPAARRSGVESRFPAGALHLGRDLSLLHENSIGALGELRHSEVAPDVSTEEAPMAAAGRKISS